MILSSPRPPSPSIRPTPLKPLVRVTPLVVRLTVIVFADWETAKTSLEDVLISESTPLESVAGTSAAGVAGAGAWAD